MEQISRASCSHSAQSSFLRVMGSSFILRMVLMMEAPALCPPPPQGQSVCDLPSHICVSSGFCVCLSVIRGSFSIDF